MRKRIISTCVFFIMVTTIILGITSKRIVYAEGSSDRQANIERFAGVDRYSTTAEICKKGWKDKSEYAVLANGENFADALTATPIAKKYNAPILLTDKDILNDNTKRELKRLAVKHVFIIGGKGVITEKIENSLNSMNIRVKRLCGKDRYETAIKIAEEVGINNNGIFVVSGEDFPDAISVATIAAQKGMPIILVPKNNLTESIDKYINSHNISKAYIIGNYEVINQNIEKQLKNIERIYGTSRYDTNVLLLEKFENELDFSSVYIANGENFPDGLSGSALASVENNPILLVSEDISESIKNLINKKFYLLKTVKVLGGKAVISDRVAKKISMNLKEINFRKLLSQGIISDFEYKIGDKISDVIDKYGNPSQTGFWSGGRYSCFEKPNICVFHGDFYSSNYITYFWVGKGYNLYGHKIGSSKDDLINNLGEPDLIDEAKEGNEMCDLGNLIYVYNSGKARLEVEVDKNNKTVTAFIWYNKEF